MKTMNPESLKMNKNRQDFTCISGMFQILFVTFFFIFIGELKGCVSKITKVPPLIDALSNFLRLSAKSSQKTAYLDILQA